MNATAKSLQEADLEDLLFIFPVSGEVDLAWQRAVLICREIAPRDGT